ncbi:E3 ubiquitin-protein ligase HAKAI homolog isoform X1 [Primulina tabacum]|uniref:E3 ubiquitin-protein ligase HAKAI homolog isoform X1 n=1 Tax=Primulina tabacum TaxID=48773 RepID=UPI003F590A26
MFKIRFSKPDSESDGSTKPVPTDAVTVACPDHLVLADLPVAKGLGSASATAVTKIVGRRSRRQLGERVHFCLSCDFPISIYGRLSPCEHALCLDCARSDSLCFMLVDAFYHHFCFFLVHSCDERILKIQTIKRTGVFICAMPYCLKSFLGKTEFESHINKNHASNHPNKKQDGNYPTFSATPGAVFSPLAATQFHDPEDESQHTQFRDLPPSNSAMHPMTMQQFPEQLAGQTLPLPPPLLPASGLSQPK